jgi:hypothetical protein
MNFFTEIRNKFTFFCLLILALSSRKKKKLSFLLSLVLALSTRKKKKLSFLLSMVKALSQEDVFVFSSNPDPNWMF